MPYKNGHYIGRRHDHDPAAGPRCRGVRQGRTEGRASTGVHDRVDGSHTACSIHRSVQPRGGLTGSTCAPWLGGARPDMHRASRKHRRCGRFAKFPAAPCKQRSTGGLRLQTAPRPRRRTGGACRCAHIAHPTDRPAYRPAQPAHAKLCSARRRASAAAEEQSTDCAPRPARRARRWRVWGVDGSVNVAAPQISA